MTRVAKAACPHAPECVPCPLRGHRYSDQLAWKRDRIRAALEAVPQLGKVDVPPVDGSRDIFGYRNVAKLVVAQGRSGRLRAGVYRPGTHRFVDAHGCHTHAPPVNRILEGALEVLTEAEIPAYDETTKSGELRFLVVRHAASTRSSVLTVVTCSEKVPGLAAACRRLARSERALTGVAWNVNPSPGNRILGDRWKTLVEPTTLLHRVGPWHLQHGPDSFFQTNVPVATRVYRRAVEGLELGPDDAVLDLYCGVGSLSLSLAGHARLVVGVEESEAAIRDAKSNARRNGIGNCRFFAGDCESRLPEVLESFPDLHAAAVNPPRKGLTAPVRSALASSSVARLAYVSCNPRSLARDLGDLREAGFRLQSVQGFDMMPQTEHVEVVAHLLR